MTLLDTTSLVNESYLRFQKSGAVALQDRSQFIAYAAHVMRSVVVDVIRKRRSERRGGAPHVELDEEQVAPDPRENEILRVHESLEELGAIDARLVQLVEMRFFAGMTENEIAEALGLGLRTVARDWEKARLFLHASLPDRAVRSSPLTCCAPQRSASRPAWRASRRLRPSSVR